WPGRAPCTGQRKKWILIMHGRHLPAVLSVAAFASLGLGSGSAPVRADVLSNLIRNHEAVQVGDLDFDQFASTSTGRMPSDAIVAVNPTFDANGSPGLRFTGGFADAFDGTNAVQQASDATLSYRVTSLGSLITDIHLSGNPQVTGPGDGLLSVVESFQ